MSFDLKADWSAAEVSALLAPVADDRSWRLELAGEGIAKRNDLTIIPDAA
ncbi:hypothetical protein BH10PSE13_BH10PSE13_08260 [soil metagenome]